ncbi:MAG: YjjG family noncanonical pyrimidine nucleotidase [Spirochaetales bacterium]|nr:YjjG family noncanonical pyrimidine nucleotidase [Spirochaetales bacterium]
MSSYNLILLDADGTLFDYDKAEESAFKKALNHYGYNGDMTAPHERYRIINSSLWSELEKGTISKRELRFERFRRLFDEFGLNYDVTPFSAYYLEKLGEGAFLIDGAEELCRQLSRIHKLVILTNGMTEVQLSRLERSSLKEYIHDIVISEEVGINKPDRGIFQYALDKVNHETLEDVLMVGDSLSSDIQGGINFGIDTCWFNPAGGENCSGLAPSYEIGALEELSSILREKE